MLLHALRAELIKCRHSPVWFAFLLLPIFPAVLGTFNYLSNLEVLENGWYSLWSQHTIFSSCFFMPAQFGVFCAWQWRLEHAGHNWNGLMTAPAPAGTLYLAKLIVSMGISLLAQVCIGVFFLLSGLLAGIQAPLPPELPGYLLFGAIGGMAVCSVELFIGLIARTFAVPVAVGLVGGIAGLLITSRGAGLAFPYSLLCLGMRANNPQLHLPAAVFLISSALYTLLFALLSIHILRTRDVTAG